MGKRKNPAAEAVRSERFKPQVIDGRRPEEESGCAICGIAGYPEQPHVEYLHGHLHCTTCGQNIDPCCEGA